MNLDPRTVVVLTVLSTFLMSISLFAVARGYLADMKGISRWATGTLFQSIGWILLALMGMVPAFVSEFGSPLIMFALAFYYHALKEFKEEPAQALWIYIVVGVSLFSSYFFLLVIPDMSARIVVASTTAAVLMFASAKTLFAKRVGKRPISHIITGSLFAGCSAVLVIRAIYYLVWNTNPDQSAFEQNIVQDIAFLTFFVAAVVSPFTFILMCNDRYNAQALIRTDELASKNIELEEASRVKGQFLATMSHELRTPLNGVIGFLNQLGKTRLDDQQRDYLHTIDLSSRMLLGVINDILDFSKIEAGKLSIEEVEIDLRELLDETISMFAVSAEDKGLDLICVIDRDVPALLLGDSLRLTQVLSNLLNNAIKFTEQGEVLLEVHLLEESDSNATLCICVTDTGIGISEKSMDRLFQPFVQADASTTRKHGGTGLGLIIARRLVEMMGGNIEIESKMWFGTRFNINLKMSKQKLSAEKMQSSGDWSHICILCVTPNTNVARGISESAAVLGINTRTVNSGVMALAILKDEKKTNKAFDAVIFDHSVNDITSGAFSEQVMQDGSVRPGYLLQLGNISLCQNSEKSDRKGYCCCISKPVKSSELYRELINLFVCDLDERSAHLSKIHAYGNGLQPKPLKGKRVLIVDDNNINRKLVQILVEELGGEFDLAENGVQALDAYSRKAFDLILMDVNMPVMDGVEATKRIRTLESGSSKTPIIALTVNALPGDKEKFISIGMDDYLSKPFNEKALLNILGKLFPQEETLQPTSLAGDTGEMGLDNAINLSNRELNTANTIPALDPKLGIELSFGDRDTWHMVLGMLLDDLEEYSSKLTGAFGDLVQLSHVSHKLVGSSCYCGTPALHQAAKQVEMYCIQGDISHLEESLAHLHLQIDRLLKLDTDGKLRDSMAEVY